MKRTFWDRRAKRFDLQPDPDDQAVANARAWLKPEHRVLEVGCATGATARALAPTVAHWYGIDISAEMVRRANEEPVPGAAFTQGTLGDVDPQDGAYDVVVAFNVLHLLDTQHALRAIAKILPPGGLLIAQTPCLGDMNLAARIALPAATFVMGLRGLRYLRFDALQAMVRADFEVLEASMPRPSATWLVARRRTS